MKRMDFQKLNEPQLIQLESELSFLIATEIDVSLFNNKFIVLRGYMYNYDNGDISKGRFTEIQYSITEEAYFELDENGKCIDKE